MDFHSAEKDIVSLIPQKPPFVMVGRVVSIDEKDIETSFFIGEDNVFVNDGFFQEPGLVENIAQTMAVRGGILHAGDDGDVPVGMIGAIKNLKIYRLPAAGTTIFTRVEIEHEVMLATIIRGEVIQDGELLAECEMKIFLKKDSQ